MSLRRLLGALSAGAAAGLCAGVVVPVFAAGPASAGSVRVGSAETLSSVAARYHTTVAALAALNGITNPNLIYSGSVLQLPSTSGSAGTVKVRAGQTLTDIARANGVSVAALAAANAITNLNLVYAGQVLELPQSGSSGGGSASSPSEITVGLGDTLTSIANRYGTTVSALALANGISNVNLVFAGMRLRLPSSQMALADYSVPLAGGSSGLPAQLLAHPSRLALRPDFTRSASTYGVPASLLEALCWWESGWQNSVVSSTGAIGVCQIEPSTASFVTGTLVPGRGLSVYSASGNIAIGAAYLHNLLQRAHGNESLAVAGYYQGLKSVQQSGMLPTTRNYVTGILAYARIFASAS